MLVGLISMDILVLLTWVLVDPLDRKLEPLQLEDPMGTDEDIKIRPSLEHCYSDHQNIWLGVVFGYKGLLLIFGLFLAYETRSMKGRTLFVINEPDLNLVPELLSVFNDASLIVKLL